MLKQLAGIDILAMYPADKSDPKAAAGWNYDTFLKAAEACAKAAIRSVWAWGRPATRSTTPASCTRRSARNWSTPKARSRWILRPSTRCSTTRRKLAPFLPHDTVSYDDASNNRALISGKSALIMNPPSAWAVAKRDAPQVASDCWHFPAPCGTEGSLHPLQLLLLRRVVVRPEQVGGEGTDHYLQERKQVEEREVASEGYDLPPLLSMYDFDVWSVSNRPKERCTTTRSGRGTMHGRASPAIRRHRT